MPCLVLSDHAEDEVVDRRVGQRGEHLPELAQPGVAERGGELGVGVRGDEVPVRPQLPDVLAGGWGARRRPAARAGRPAAPGVRPVSGSASAVLAMAMALRSFVLERGAARRRCELLAVSPVARERPPSSLRGRVVRKHVGTQPYRRCATCLRDCVRVTVTREEARTGRRGGAARRHHHGDPPRGDAGTRRGRLRPALHRGGGPAGRGRQDRDLPAVELEAGAGAGDRRRRGRPASCRCWTPAASRGDLELLLTVVSHALRHPLASQIIPDLLAEAARNPQHRRDPPAGAAAPSSRRSAASWSAGRSQRGELPADTDPDAAVDLIVGPLYWRLAIARLPLTDGYLDKLVESVAAGLGADSVLPRPRAAPMPG